VQTQFQRTLQASGGEAPPSPENIAAKNHQHFKGAPKFRAETTRSILLPDLFAARMHFLVNA